MFLTVVSVDILKLNVYIKSILKLLKKEILNEEDSFLLIFLILPIFTTVSMAERRPDLAVTSIWIGSRTVEACYVYVTVQNLGSEPIPWELIRNRKIVVRVSDQSQTVELFPTNNLLGIRAPDVLRLPPSIGVVRAGQGKTFEAEIDPRHVVYWDSHPSNNKLVETINCPYVPDLAVTRIYKKSGKNGCEVWVEVKNLGKGWVSTEVFSNMQLRIEKGRRVIYSKKLERIRNAGEVRKPGGAVEVKVPGLRINPWERVQIEARLYLPPTYDYLRDINRTNDSKTAVLFCNTNLLGPNKEKFEKKTKGVKRSVPQSFGSPISPPPILRKGPITH